MHDHDLGLQHDVARLLGRRRALMKHFGSAKSVSRAGIEDLKAVDGISAEMAQKIYDFFNERKQ